MRPIDIEVLLHYYTRGDDYRDGDFSAPAVRELIDIFTSELDLLRASMRERKFGQPMAAYEITERGKVYIEALMRVQLPVQKWVMPDAA